MIFDILVIVVGAGSVLINLLFPRHRAIDLVYKTNSVKLKGLRDEIKYDRIEAEKLRSTSVQLAAQAVAAREAAQESLRKAEAALIWTEELRDRTNELHEQMRERVPEPTPHRGVADYFQ